MSFAIKRLTEVAGPWRCDGSTVDSISTEILRNTRMASGIFKVNFGWETKIYTNSLTNLGI